MKTKYDQPIQNISNGTGIGTQARTTLLGFLSLLLVLSTETRGAIPDGPADFTITNTVMTSDPEPFGVNLGGRFLNNWTRDPGMEPVILRAKGIAADGGEDFIENPGFPGTSYDDTIGDGFFDGAPIRIYRETQGELNLLRTSTIASYLGRAESGSRIVLSESGPPIEAGDLYFIDAQFDNIPFDRLGPAAIENVSQSDVWIRLGPVDLFRDRSTVAPESGGFTSLRVSTTSPDFVGIAQAAYGPPDAYLESLVPGRTYRVEAWMRQVGIPEGEVHFSMEGSYAGIEHRFTNITDSWQHVSFEFVAPARPAPGSELTLHRLMFEGPATLWIDNFLIYDTTMEPLAVLPEARNALVDFAGGPLRIWSGHTNEQLGTSLEDWTNPDLLALRQYHFWEGASVPDYSFKLPSALPLCRDVGFSPWLVVGPYFSEEEWLGLVEYLAGPAGTPYGDKRIAQGQVTPWVDEFDRIRIEIGNESWNGFFVWNFTALNHGRLAEHIIQTIHSSPYYPAIADKLEFILNGWIISSGVEGYGAVAIQQSPSAHSTGIASYIGGWEVADQVGGTEVTDEGFQEYMLYPPSFIKYFTDEHASTRDFFASLGRDYNVAVYEGGPGYPLPMPGAVENPVAEIYGKSLAAAVATLDTYLYFAYQGFGPMAFYDFEPGPNHTSHTFLSDGYRPHAPWLALQMANRYATGDMLVTSINSAPTIDVPATDDTPLIPNVPLLASYARRNGPDYSVFVLSRQMDLTTPVTLRLPFTSASRVTRYELAGDPRANNIDSLEVSITQHPVDDFSPDYQFTMPPGSIFLFVFEGTTTEAQTQPAVLAEVAPDQDLETSEPFAAFNVEFSESVTGFETNDIILQGITEADFIELYELEPYTGQHYRVDVHGLGSSGFVSIAIPAGAAFSETGSPSTPSIFISDPVHYIAPVVIPPTDFPEIIFPASGTTLDGISVDFEWTSNGTDVDEWFLDVGSFPDGSDVYSEGFSAASTSQTIFPLPSDGRTVHATLWYRMGDEWGFSAHEYTAHIAEMDPANPPALSAPEPGETMHGTEVRLEWTANGYPVEAWFVDVGSFLDGSDIFVGEYLAETTSVIVPNLPQDGRDIYVRLWHRIGWDWFYTDTVFQAPTP